LTIGGGKGVKGGGTGLPKGGGYGQKGEVLKAQPGGLLDSGGRAGVGKVSSKGRETK